MRGTFTYHNPTKLYFGENALDGLKAELEACGLKREGENSLISGNPSMCIWVIRARSLVFCGANGFLAL